MSDLIEVRLVTIADAPAIARILYEAFASYEPLYTPQGFAATTPSGEILGARMSEGPTWVAIQKDAMDDFLAKVRRAVRLGGQLVIIDQSAPTGEDKSVAMGNSYATRQLQDGRQYTIVKTFYALALLEEKLMVLGFQVTVHQLDDSFFLLSAQRRKNT